MVKYKYTDEPLAKLASEDDLMAETARERRVPILHGVKIGLHNPCQPRICSDCSKFTEKRSIKKNEPIVMQYSK